MTLNLTKQTEGCWAEGGWEKEGGGMDIGEGMCYGECCEVCKPGDSQICTPGANNTLYVNLKKKEEEEDYYKSNGMVFSKECVIRHILLKYQVK